MKTGAIATLPIVICTQFYLILESEKTCHLQNPQKLFHHTAGTAAQHSSWHPGASKPKSASNI